MTRILPGVIAMAIIVVASNILVQFLILDGLLTWGAFTYPLAFLVTDITNRVYGASDARRVILVGFVVGIICSLIGSQIMLQGDGYTYPAVAVRVAIGSGTAFFVAQLLDVAVFNRLRDSGWWKAPLVSSILSSAVDTALFFSIAFAGFISLGEYADGEVSWALEAVPLLNVGPEAPLWITLALADGGVKLAVALIALVPFRVIVGQIMAKRAVA